MKGTQLKIVQTEQYDNAGADVKPQVNSLAATNADAFVLGGGVARVPGRAQRGGRRGLEADHVHVGHVRVEGAAQLGGRGRQRRVQRHAAARPGRSRRTRQPGDDSSTRQQVAKYYPPQGRHVDDGIVAYGWTTGALLVKTLESSPKLDRGSVMEAARTFTDVSDVGLQIPAAKWNTSADDWFIGETFQFVQYDATARHTTAVGPLTDDDGKTASLTPAELDQPVASASRRYVARGPRGR